MVGLVSVGQKSDSSSRDETNIMSRFKPGVKITYLSDKVCSCSKYPHRKRSKREKMSYLIIPGLWREGTFLQLYRVLGVWGILDEP